MKARAPGRGLVLVNLFYCFVRFGRQNMELSLMFMVSIARTAYMVNFILIFSHINIQGTFSRSSSLLACYQFSLNYNNWLYHVVKGNCSRLLKFPQKKLGQFREGRVDCLTIACLSWRG